VSCTALQHIRHQIKDYTIDIGCFSAKQTTLRSKKNYS